MYPQNNTSKWEIGLLILSDVVADPECFPLSLTHSVNTNWKATGRLLLIFSTDTIIQPSLHDELGRGGKDLSVKLKRNCYMQAFYAFEGLSMLPLFPC